MIYSIRIRELWTVENSMWNSVCMLVKLIISVCDSLDIRLT